MRRRKPGRLLRELSDDAPLEYLGSWFTGCILLFAPGEIEARLLRGCPRIGLYKLTKRGCRWEKT
jgi:hypothetical protein